MPKFFKNMLPELLNFLCSNDGLIHQTIVPVMYFINPLVPRVFLPVHIFFWLVIFVPIWLHEPYYLNSQKNEKSFFRSVAFAFAIYYVVMLCFCITMRAIVCKAARYPDIRAKMLS